MPNSTQVAARFRNTRSSAVTILSTGGELEEDVLERGLLGVHAGHGRRGRVRRKRTAGGSGRTPEGVCRVRRRGDDACPGRALRSRRGGVALRSRIRADADAQRPVIDAAIGVVVFAASLGQLAAGGTDLVEGSGEVDAAGVLLSALASLPLAARRFAPLPVFVLTAVASTVLRGVADPAGPPIGPTLALYWVAAAGDESRARTPLILTLAGALLAAHVTAAGLARHAFPGTESLFGVLVWGGAWL